jgi:hypothetical protein
VDASLWIDFSRARSPQSLRDFIAPYIFDPEACLAEPIRFEVPRGHCRLTAQMIKAGTSLPASARPELSPIKPLHLVGLRRSLVSITASNLSALSTFDLTLSSSAVSARDIAYLSD